MTHSEWIDPILAAQKCTPAEQEIVRLRNRQISWTTITQLTSRSRGVVRREWASANQKVNGNVIVEEDAATKRARQARDPDVHRTNQGIPMVGTRGAIFGTQPDQITRSGK